MLKIDLYTIKGTKKGEVSLPKEFGGDINLDLLAQAVRVYEERGHVGLRQTKTRAEINRTTKKVYKQKGTGGARHGSRRANVFVGGGVAHGPRAIRRELGLSDSMKLGSKLAAFNLKVGDKKMIAVEGLSKIGKTKIAGQFIDKLSEEIKFKKVTFALSDKNKGEGKFLRNLSNVTIVPYKDINAFDVYYGGLVVLDSDVLDSVTKVKPEKKSTVKKATKAKVDKK